LRQKKNFLSTLFLSQGIPMMLHGDEMSRTQGGNNNGYCQDNEITWMNWDLDEDEREILEFSKRIINYRLAHPNLHRKKFFRGDGDLMWFDTQGNYMSQEDWDAFYAKTIMLYLDGSKIDDYDENGDPLTDDSFLIVFNGHYEEMSFKMPPADVAGSWELVIDTTLGEGFLSDDNRFPTQAEADVLIESRSLRLYNAR
jgi:glycogen operon protein